MAKIIATTSKEVKKVKTGDHIIVASNSTVFIASVREAIIEDLNVAKLKLFSTQFKKHFIEVEMKFRKNGNYYFMFENMRYTVIRICNNDLNV